MATEPLGLSVEAETLNSHCFETGVDSWAFGLPTGLKINPTSGAITGTVAPGTAADGPYAVTVVAASGSYYATQDFNYAREIPKPLAEADLLK